jgi:hypothetical protein
MRDRANQYFLLLGAYRDNAQLDRNLALANAQLEDYSHTLEAKAQERT